jgi:diguanylate cyclase (GGDEF)-like protein
MSAHKPSAPSKLQKLREAYINQLPAQIGSIREMFSALDQENPGQEAMEDFHRAVHTMKGSSAAFGLNDVSAAAKEAEDLARLAMAGTVPGETPWGPDMEARLAKVERAVRDMGSGQASDQVRLDVAAAEVIHCGSERKVVYLCEDDPLQLTSLTTQIGCFGFEVSSFQDLESFESAVEKCAPDVILMDMVHPGNRTGGAQIVEKIRGKGGRNIPVVFISCESEIGTRLAAVRAGCDAYFVKPVNPTDLCATLRALASTEQPEPYRIMIVDDDPQVCARQAAILQEAGMVTLGVHDPMQSLTHLTEFKPDLILMDMHMPGCNGLELAGVIRQMDAYLSIPIVFLSGESDQDLQIDAKRIGGDEFLHKDIEPRHLVSTVTVRAQRMKLLRSFMIRDSLTGLYNHSTTKEHLELSVARAQRSGENACFAMLDLDNFKGVNDRYGHPTGDRVLVALANLLRQRLRKSDVIGRYGGEEFAVILPASSMQEAVGLMDSLRQCFEGIRFPTEDGYFTSTFSCGLASLSSHEGAERLCLAADEALYSAKKAGRNRVVAAERYMTDAELKDMKVLVVDDAAPIRSILANMLSGSGFADIREAKNGQEAWEIMQSAKFDLVIADWYMPKMNGIELLRLIRADQAHGDTPFVMITGESDMNSVREAIKAGVSEYILKPVYAEEFSKKIIRVLCRDKAAPKSPD